MDVVNADGNKVNLLLTSPLVLSGQIVTSLTLHMWVHQSCHRHLKKNMMQLALALKGLCGVGDEWKALLILAFAAEQGSPPAQNNLAFALEHSKTFDLPERFPHILLDLALPT